MTIHQATKSQAGTTKTQLFSSILTKDHVVSDLLLTKVNQSAFSCNVNLLLPLTNWSNKAFFKNRFLLSGYA